MRTRISDVSIEPMSASEYFHSDFIPIIRSGAWADIGFRPSMEDVYVCVDNFAEDFGVENISGGPNAFYGVLLFKLVVLYGFPCFLSPSMELKPIVISLIRFLMGMVESMLQILPAVIC